LHSEEKSIAETDEIVNTTICSFETLLYAWVKNIVVTNEVEVYLTNFYEKELTIKGITGI